MNERMKELYQTVLAESENMRWNIEDAEKFAELTVRDCIQTLVNHGYTDAASALSDAQFGPGTEWQKYQFPDI